MHTSRGCVPCPVPYRPIARTSLRTSWPGPGPSFADDRSSISCGSGLPWCSSCTRNRPCRTPRPRLGSRRIPTPYGSGGGAGPRGTTPWRMPRDGDARPPFPPLDGAIIKAIACEAVDQTGLPLSRLSLADLTTRAHYALGRPISRSTVWRALDGDAIKPWRYEHWIFPRDPRFAEKAGVILDLYAGQWEGKALGREDHIISADEKTSIQARVRCHPGTAPAPGRARRVEFEYDRGGALQYLAAWDVRRGYVMGRCEPKTGIGPFGRLVKQVLAEEPYRSSERLFWVVDNGSSHRGEAAKKR